jgi:hypothetical protein
MARKPRPSEIAAKATAKKLAAKKAAPKKAAAKKREAKHGGKVITREDILEAEQLNNVPATIKLPSAKYIDDFVKKTLANLTKEKDSAVADIRNAFGTAEDKNHVEKRAIAIAIRLFKLPDSKLQQTLYHLTHYIAALSLWERALKQGQLDLEKAGGADDEEGEGEEAAGDQPGEMQTDEGTAALPSGSPRLKIVDAPQSTADAMGEAIEQDRKTA